MNSVNTKTNDSLYIVTVDIEKFNRTWPGSRLNSDGEIRLTYSTKTNELVDYTLIGQEDDIAETVEFSAVVDQYQL